MKPLYEHLTESFTLNESSDQLYTAYKAFERVTGISTGYNPKKNFKGTVYGIDMWGLGGRSFLISGRSSNEVEQELKKADQEIIDKRKVIDKFVKSYSEAGLKVVFKETKGGRVEKINDRELGIIYGTRTVPTLDFTISVVPQKAVQVSSNDSVESNIQFSVLQPLNHVKLVTSRHKQTKGRTVEAIVKYNYRNYAHFIDVSTGELYEIKSTQAKSIELVSEKDPTVNRITFEKIYDKFWHKVNVGDKLSILSKRSKKSDSPEQVTVSYMDVDRIVLDREVGTLTISHKTEFKKLELV